ncbi:PREDICTED: proline- glutamic [Prunus dulcis]|uniref:PREDICTED: proline- glutamic n=1 Tax=Prunus dulcis TaxID=3755 RepID=A0A5E4FWU3_PRUDU|nr:PREDICTED: proline- glutamic [Prunus dulcis]
MRRTNTLITDDILFVKPGLYRLWVLPFSCLNFFNIQGDALKSEGWRSDLAALRALLAYFLSSSCVRLPYLAEGLDIFRRGKQETGTKLAEFCAHALLAFEVLMHPRVLPLADFANAPSLSDGVRHKLPENIYSDSLRHQTPFSTDIQGMRAQRPFCL